MIKNYIKIALRNIKKHKGYSFINIAGLSIGMARCLLITAWVMDELSYDRFHEHAANLYKIEFDQNYSGNLYHVNVTPHPLAPALREEIPGITGVARVAWLGSILTKYEEKSFFEDRGYAVDPSFFNMFSFPFVQGDIASSLDNPFSVVLTEELAKKYFADEDPLGKVIHLNNQYDFTVTGLIKDVPLNSTLQFDIIVPYDFLRVSGVQTDRWSDNSITTYVRLDEKRSLKEVTNKVNSTVAQHKDTTDIEYSLSALTRIHLYGHSGFSEGRGAIQYVYIFSMIALFVLFIACINFMNLATARYTKRAREVGLRKVVGARRGQIIRQFFSESCLYALFSLFLALLLFMLFLPAFNSLSGKELSLEISNFGYILAGILGMTLFTGLVSGSYPALFLSAFQPARVLKGTLKSGTKKLNFRKILVVVQFSLSIGLIIGTGVIYNQLEYMRNSDLGFGKDHLVYMPMRGSVLKSYNAFKAELLKNPAILGVSASTYKPMAFYGSSDGANWEGKDPNRKVSMCFNKVEYDFFKTLDVEMVKGRDFSRDHSTDAQSAFIVNEEAERLMDKDSALGDKFTFFGNTGTIVGVTKNFHFQSLREKIEPLVIMLEDSDLSFLLIRIQSQEISTSLEFIKNSWGRIITNYPFEYSFMNEEFDRLYKAEERMGDVLKYFTILAIFIACLGLFGFASFAAEQRTKEIGIRKILGAKVSQITLLICR